ncbi:MAG: transglutaminase-like domain-containing protein [Chloroflexi bacterium]|nr:transglutaminase-like domain-containing protein [Chloroflexota bacterium]
MTYSDTIPAPPPGTDPLNWFLFGWKSGFCNYYASAEVLLLRSAGIPARMVVGYSQGTSGNYGMYSVRGQDAHAWPEVYFPKIGWVEFEPTVNQDALIRPSGEETNPGGNPNQFPAAIDGLENQPRGGHEAEDPATADAAISATFWGLTRGQWLWVIISLVAIAAMGISVWQIQRTRSFSQRAPRVIKAIYSRYNLRIPIWVERWERWGEVSDVEHAFHAINQALNWLRQPQPNHVTPTERAELLKSLIPEAAEDVELISAALEQTLFTPHPAEPADAIRAGWRIRYFTALKIILRRIYGDKQ